MLNVDSLPLYLNIEIYFFKDKCCLRIHNNIASLYSTLCNRCIEYICYTENPYWIVTNSGINWKQNEEEKRREKNKLHHLNTNTRDNYERRNLPQIGRAIDRNSTHFLLSPTIKRIKLIDRIKTNKNRKRKKINRIR